MLFLLEAFAPEGAPTQYPDRWNEERIERKGSKERIQARRSWQMKGRK